MRRPVELTVLAGIYGTMTVVAVVVVALIITQSHNGSDRADGDVRVVPRATFKAPTSPNGTFVVVASRDIPAGSRIEARMVKITEVPRAQAPTDAFNDMARVVGQTATVNIAEGDQLAKSTVSPIPRP